MSEVLVHVIVSVIEKNLDTENCSCEKHLFDKLACENEMLNTNATQLHDEKGTCEKTIIALFIRFHW